jgi:hypothetical protein
MTSDMHVGGQDVVVPELLKEPHWDDSKLSSTSDRCQAEFVASGRLRSIAHFSNQILDFVIRPSGAGLQRPEHDEDAINEEEGRPGGQLVLCFEDFDQALRQLNTGELMRTIVATPSGSLYCARVKQALHLVGITHAPDGVDDLDTTMNRLVTMVRDEVHNLPDERLGGDRRWHLSAVPPITEHQFAFEVGLTALESPHLETRLRSLWPRFVNCEDLHYAALYRDWSLVCVGDAFDDDRISPRFMNIEPPRRRSLYRDIAHRLRADIARLRDVLHPVTADPINRLVLDVQEGSVYIHWLGTGTGDFILGVTLNQILVHAAEQRLRGLIAELPSSNVGLV